jgi:hypothetical protein
MYLYEYSDFIDFKNLSVQSSNMLKGQGLRACVHRGESSCVVLCNSKKKW